MAASSIPPNIQQAVAQFQIEADKIIRPLVDKLKTTKAPPIVYHYTGDVGLRGILETGQLWLTDVFTLNDPSELNHGFAIMLKVLTEKASGSADAQYFAKSLVDFKNRIGIRQSGHYFICSFSQVGDDLGQWRAYADNGRGYVLGFDTTQLETAFTKEGQPGYAQASPLIYDDAQLEGMHRQIVDKLFQLISLPCGSTAVEAEWYTYLTLKALEAGLNFKHPAYINEQEYRFLEAHPIDKPVPGAKFRHRAHTLVRYREFNWRQMAPDSLKQIIIGPAADRPRSFQFVADCVKFFHPGTVKITHSNIPYRAT